MANKRDFKKSIDAIGGAICNEMMVAYYNIEGADKNAIANREGTWRGCQSQKQFKRIL